MWFPEEYQVLHKNREDYAINNNSYESWWAVYNEEVEGKTQANYIKVSFQPVILQMRIFMLKRYSREDLGQVPLRR